MSAINDLVRKFKKAVTDPDDPSRGKRHFDWEPAAAMPAPPASRPQAEAAPPPAPAAEGSPNWKRGPSEAASVVGTGVPADVEDFGIVYKSASVQPPGHGYGVDRVAAMLGHKSLAGLDKSVKASAVLAALDAACVSLQEVVHDALLRYKALLAFEAAKELELLQVRPRSERRMEELKASVDAFGKKKNAEIDAMTRESAAAAAALTRLETRRRAEEERFYRTISPFVEPMPARVIPMTPKPAEAAPAAPPPAAPPGKEEPKP